MLKAYLMIDTAAGTSKTICEELRKIECVTEAHVVAGDFDIVVEAEGQEVYELLHAITSEIRPLEGIGTIRTYVCLSEESEGLPDGIEDEGLPDGIEDEGPPDESR